MVSKDREFYLLQFDMLFDYTCTLTWVDNLIKPVVCKKPITHHKW